jgi:YesN/AraC family two-component response regulator
LTQYLEEENCNVKQARNSKEALAMFVDFKPAVVLLDINMPKINSLKVLKMLKENYPEVYIIMTTGVATFAAIRECLAIWILTDLAPIFALLISLEFIGTGIPT